MFPAFGATMSTMLELAFEIDGAMASPIGYAMLTLGASKQLLKKGYVEINEDITNEDSQFATRLTTAGIEFLNNSTTSEPAIAAVPTPEKVYTMTILSNVPKPERNARKSGGGRKSKYPFETMEIGDMFFVADSAIKSGDAFKALTSVIGAVHTRYSSPTEETRTNRKGATVPVMIRAREFSVRSFELEGVAGAGVWRDK